MSKFLESLTWDEALAVARAYYSEDVSAATDVIVRLERDEAQVLAHRLGNLVVAARKIAPGAPFEVWLKLVQEHLVNDIP